MKKRLVCCNICGSPRFNVLFPDELADAQPSVDYNFTPATRKTYQIVRCDSCGLVYTNPMPCLESTYKDSSDEVYLASRAQRVVTSTKLVHKIQDFTKRGKLLDVGCATGIFLDVAAQYFEVEGVELSKWARDIASQNHKVYDKKLSELPFSREYDIVTLLGVIEHFEDPMTELVNINRLLKPGGRVVIYTGDIDAWLPRLLRKKWWWFQGMHLYYFSRETLTLLLEKCGFSVDIATKHTSYFQLFSLATSIRRYYLGRFICPFLEASPIRNIMIPLRISGEMLLFARKINA